MADALTWKATCTAVDGDVVPAVRSITVVALDSGSFRVATVAAATVELTRVRHNPP
jgi:hypothetical protein